MKGFPTITSNKNDEQPLSSGNPICAAAQDWITANPSHQSLQGTTLNGQPTSVYFQYHAGTNAANGCLVKAIPAV